jgi:hypothetical protein
MTRRKGLRKLFAGLNEVKRLHAQGAREGPYQLPGEYTRAAFERFRDISEDAYRFAYIEEDKTVLVYGDISLPHEACSRRLPFQILRQLEERLQQAPPTGDEILDILSDPQFRDSGAVLQKLTEDPAHPFPRRSHHSHGRRHNGVILKEPDFNISMRSGAYVVPLVLGEVAWNNESFSELVSEVWLERTAAPVVIGLKADVS